MRKLNLRIQIITMAILTLGIMSCNNTKKDKTDNTATEMPMNGDHDNTADSDHDNSDGHHGTDNDSSSDSRSIDANTKKNVATTPIIDAYIQVKNGLVSDSKEDAAKGGTALLAAFSKFDMTTLTGDTHKEYMEILESAKEHSEHIVKSPIDHQREHFEVLSTDINDLIALLGTEKTLYKDFCPMANNNKGAYWLSEIEGIKNPYFGAKMMKCGSVKEQIN